MGHLLTFYEPAGLLSERLVCARFSMLSHGKSQLFIDNKQVWSPKGEKVIIKPSLPTLCVCVKKKKSNHTTQSPLRRFYLQSHSLTSEIRLSAHHPLSCFGCSEFRSLLNSLQLGAGSLSAYRVVRGWQRHAAFSLPCGILIPLGFLLPASSASKFLRPH